MLTHLDLGGGPGGQGELGPLLGRLLQPVPGAAPTLPVAVPAGVGTLGSRHPPSTCRRHGHGLHTDRRHFCHRPCLHSDRRHGPYRNRHGLSEARSHHQSLRSRCGCRRHGLSLRPYRGHGRKSRGPTAADGLAKVEEKAVYLVAFPGGRRGAPPPVVRGVRPGDGS